LLASMALVGAPLAWGQETSASVVEDSGRETAFLGGFLKETRVIYPLRIGQWEAQGEHLYQEQELGASVRYIHHKEKDRWIDLYFYPAGVLTEAQFATVVDGTLEGIGLSSGQAGGYSEVDIGEPVRMALTTGGGKERREVAAYSSSMRLVRDGKTYHSAMVMLVDQLYFFKGRFSAEEKSLSRPATLKQLEGFMESVLRETTVRSAGDCWMQPPIVQKAALLADAPGQLASNSKDGVLSAVAYADRVEALDAQSPEAIVMQFLSMHLSGRAVSGCGPVEDINQPVPEGKREIRLEFRAPSTEGDPQSSPLRQNVIGVS
ncbi:MAG: hypothetical protein ABWX88_02600, partial [Pseudoxanthomonas sp.]